MPLYGNISQDRGPLGTLRDIQELEEDYGVLIADHMDGLF